MFVLNQGCPPSREVPIDSARAALLFIDVQNYTAHSEGGEYASLTATERESRYGWFFRTLHETAVPNMQRLQAACRRAKIEVLYTVIEALTRDGRDLSLDYKISGLFVPRGSWDAKVQDAIAPAGDEIVVPKTSSSVHLDEHRLRAAQSRLEVADHRRGADRSVHRLGRTGRLRSRLSGDCADRRLRDSEPGAA
jgi:nicotinamidase-related amidase